MVQKRVALTVSVPPALARKFERMANAALKSKSQLFREMFRNYEQRILEDEFCRLQRYGVQQARKKGLYTEEEVEALVFQDR
jgi:metal-responsive CopG/Arc/MetJ family transcriptional regulator